MKLRCIADFSAWLLRNNPENKTKPGWSVVPELCPQGMSGDVTVNCFRFAGLFGKNPVQLAAEAADFFRAHEDIASAEAVKAFVNITLKPGALYRDTVADLPALLAEGTLSESERRRILIEYSAPNTNKPQHLGHVRNNTIGMSLCSLLARVGNTVIPINLVNDRGIHICKSMLAYQRFGNGSTPESTGIKGDHFVGDYYVKYNAALSEQIKALRESDPSTASASDEELFLRTEIGAAAQKMLLDW